MVSKNNKAGSGERRNSGKNKKGRVSPALQKSVNSKLAMSDPLRFRGALFETWVIGELLKSRFNRGLVSNLYFWRDNTGNEIDVLAESAGRLIPVEIKSGQTVTKDYMTGLKKWLDIAESTAGTPWLIYGGDEGHRRSGIEILPWRDMKQLAEKI